MSSHLKILMMTNTYSPIVGGLERSVQSFTEEFRRMGHRVMIVAPQFDEVSGECPDVIRIPAIQKFNHTDFSINLPMPGLLSKLAKDFEPDIVHAHHPFLVGDLALRLCGQYNIPLIFTYHTMFDQYTHYLPIHNEFVKRFLLELSVGFANLANCVFAPSESLRFFLKAKGVRVPIEVVPSGVNVEELRQGDGVRVRNDFHIPHDAFVVGTVGRIAPEKNLEFLSRAVISFMKKQPRTHFLMVGKGPLEPLIRIVFREAGLENRCHFAGVITGNGLADYYHAMDVFAFASKSETQGMVLFEAMAAGVPLVALSASAVDEVVNDFENGRLVAHEDALEFESCLRWCLSRNPDEYCQLQARGQEMARHYSLARCADLAVNAYEKNRSKTDAPWHRDYHGWKHAMRRIKTEWDLFANLSRASRRSFAESMRHHESKTR